MPDQNVITASPVAAEYKQPPAFTLVIFGATGDLTRRKLIPSIYNLFCRRLLPDDFSLVAFARREFSDQAYRDWILRSVKESNPGAKIERDCWNRFAARMVYHRSTFEERAGFASLLQRLTDLAAEDKGPRNCLFYLACHPASYEQIITHLHGIGIPSYCSGIQKPRIIIEKPIGRDLRSAVELNHQLSSVFAEEQIYRIDHYLGKDSVQNLLVLRFANSIFESVWNRQFIDHVQISVCEKIGIGTRGAYYEQTGAMRDIVQNHMMHLLSLVAMEPPYSLRAGAVRDEKVRVLHSLRPITSTCAAGEVVLGQYTAGTIPAGNFATSIGSANTPDNGIIATNGGNPGNGTGGAQRGYLDEPDVAPDSRTETFAAIKMFIDNWRWAGVPFYLRTGKCLPIRISEIGVHFKAIPKILFNAARDINLPPNLLSIRIQPNEGITLRFQVKKPGPATYIEPLNMDFGYASSFGITPSEAYERLLLDAIQGDQTLFTRSDEVEAAWKFIDPIIKGCSQCRPEGYPAGSWGPEKANLLIESDGRRWQLNKRPIEKDESGQI